MSEIHLPTLNFLCFGAGAIGTYLGGSLALSGHRVVFLERPELAPTLLERGLCLHKEGQEFRIPAPDVVVSLEEALTHGPFDAAILAVKSFDTQTLLESLIPYKVAMPPILCFQNGVENELRLMETLGESRVIPATVTTAIGRRGPGEIVVERLRGVGVSADHILAHTLVAVLDRAGLRAQAYENAQAMKWSKMFTNLPANASSAILNMNPAEIYAHPGLCAMEVEMLRETLRVMAALHIPIIDLPATPVRGLKYLVTLLPPALSRPLLSRVLGAGRGAKMPSFHIDLYAGRGKSEVDYLNGAVVRFGKLVGVPTPVNQLLNETLQALTDGKIPLNQYSRSPQTFLSLLKP